MDIRIVKRQARKQLHAGLSFPVWYFAKGSSVGERRTLRLHKTFEALGELLRGGFAERQEIIPKAIFLLSEGPISKDAVFVTDWEGVFRLDNLLVADDITQTAELVKMPPSFVLSKGWDLTLLYGGLGEPE